MSSILEQLDLAFRQCFAGLGFPEDLGAVRESDRPDLAPFQCNGAMAAAGILKKQGQKANPREIAQNVAAALKDHELISDLEIAGPGFINIVPKSDVVSARAQSLFADELTGLIPTEPQTIVIDYGGPNVAKPMHVGHLRSAVIGDSLKRALRAKGHKVIGDVHLGDWGLQMGHLITELECEQPGLIYFDAAVTGAYPAEPPVTIDDLSRLYPQASGKAKADPERMELSRKATAELQAGRPGYRALLEHFINVSIAALKVDYGRLGVEFDLWKGEAAVDPLIPGMIDDLKSKGITEDSDGALIIRVAEDSDKKEVPPVILLSSTGAALYHTTDLATLIDRKREIDPDLILYVVDQRQAQHFEQVFRAAVKAGWYRADQMEHLGFGTVNGPDGKPFKTRDGGVLRLADLMQMATEAAEIRLTEAGLGQDYDPGERADIAHKVGMAAIKFADLQNQRMTNYIFDLDRFSSFEGKTGPYLLYATVRIKSLLRKAAEMSVAAGDIDAAHKSEQQLVFALDGFGRALDQTIAKRAPHIMCEHIFRLAQSFSRFYTDCPILKDDIAPDMKASRLALAETTLRPLEPGLHILGIDAPERM